jgi:nucleoside 2-deoxyribosyltransferase
MRPRVVLCGSFQRDPAGLKRLFRELEITGCRVLSPISLEFDDDDSFVKAPTETDLSPADIERFHLRAIRDADFVLLHVPAGHIGISGAYEIGYASALGKPVYSLAAPTDSMLATRVQTTRSVFEVLDQLQLTSF